MVRISKSKLFGSGSSSSKKPKLPKDESHHKHSHEHKKHLKSADLRSLLKKSKLKKEKECKRESKDKEKDKEKEREKLLKEMKKRELEKLDDSSSSSLDDLSDMYSDSDSNSNSSGSSSDSEMESNPINELNLDQIKPEKSMENNLVNDKLRVDIMSRDYVNICTQIHLLSKTLTCSKQEKAKIATLVYYYIKYFLYSCCIKKKPIFDWLEEFKDKIHIY